MRLNKDLLEFVELLNANGVEYLIVGVLGSLGINADDLPAGPNRPTRRQCRTAST
jgi:hypothetical protein